MEKSEGVATKFKDFMREIEEEARAEGPEAVAELEALRAHFRLVRSEATAGELMKNGLPRVAWEGATKDGVRYRLVLVGGQSYTEKYPGSVRPGEVVMLEVAIGANALGAEQWQRIRYEDDDEGKDGAIQALVRHAMTFDGPHCTGCLDAGFVDEGCANGDGFKPPCAKCERGRQVAEARR